MRHKKTLRAFDITVQISVQVGCSVDQFFSSKTKSFFAWLCLDGDGTFSVSVICAEEAAVDPYATVDATA